MTDETIDLQDTILHCLSIVPAYARGGAARMISPDSSVRRTTRIALAIIVLGAVLAIAFNATSPPASYEARESTSLATADSTPVAFPTPATGLVRTSKYVVDEGAPFQVQTAAGRHNTLARLVRLPEGEIAAELFVRAGDKHEVMLQPGLYELRYAIGEIWYGSDLLFGARTQYKRADSDFHLRELVDGYDGYVVELIPQAGGNLAEQSIDATRF